MVIAELKAIQDRAGFISEQALRELSARINVPVCDLHGVASFYPHFRLKPPPKASIHVCTDAPCHLKNADDLLLRIKRMAENDPTVEVKACSCLGQCDGAPGVLINDHPYARKSEEEILSMARSAILGQKIEHQHFATVKGPFKSDRYASDVEWFDALRGLLKSGEFAGVIDKIKTANLRGMGGAGTPAFRKWDTCQKQQSDQKYVVCNADESEVGTFKDREILKALPHLLIEAMTIAGVTIGATRGFIYIRHEYHEQIDILRAAIASAKEKGVLGANVCGSGKRFDLEVFVSPGGYVQGEETALLEAIEGRRGQPRNKPWDVGMAKGIPAFQGLWGKPTLVNNVETFIYLPAILMKGSEWFVKQGINGSQGLKWIGVGGHVQKPGVFEVPMGTRYIDVINNQCGGMIGKKKLKAICPSGPTGGILPAEMANEPIDFAVRGPKGEPVNKWAQIGSNGVGSGATIVIADGTNLVDLALNFTRFYRNESCGKCVPCRVGSQKIVDIIAGILAGTARDEDLAEIEQLADVLYATSICGLGQVVPEPIRTVLKFFRPEVDALLKRKTQK